MNKTLLDRKNKIDKYLKRKKHLCLFDLFFNDLDKFVLYVRLDYVKTNNTYKVVWVNVTQMNSNRTEDWINMNLIYPSEVEKIKSYIAQNGITSDYEDDSNVNSKCIMNSYITNYENNRKTFEFNRYIPKCWEFLADVLYVLFEALPKYLYPEFQILIENLIQPKKDQIFVCDKEKDDIDDLFNDNTKITGADIYNQNRVTYIEKVKDVYYSIVSTDSNHLVSVYDIKETNEMQLSCTCENNEFCEHMYATLQAIKDNKEYKYFKIARIEDDKSLIDNINNFNYYLCAGIHEDNFVVILADSFQFLPILENGKLNYKIIEDDDKKTLEKELKKYLNKNKK